MRNGFDISVYQGVIDWTQVAGAEMDFVFIRAQVGTTVDTLLQNNLNGAKSVGLEASVYHVVHEDISGETQAGAFLGCLRCGTALEQVGEEWRCPACFERDAAVNVD